MQSQHVINWLDFTHPERKMLFVHDYSVKN